VVVGRHLLYRQAPNAAAAVWVWVTLGLDKDSRRLAYAYALGDGHDTAASNQFLGTLDTANSEYSWAPRPLGYNQLTGAVLSSPLFLFTGFVRRPFRSVLVTSRKCDQSLTSRLEYRGVEDDHTIQAHSTAEIQTRLPAILVVLSPSFKCVPSSTQPR